MSRWLANLIGVLAAAGVVVAGLFAGAPPAAANGPANPMRLLPPPVASRGVGEIPVGSSIEMWGQPSRLNLFWTQDSAETVAHKYEDAWKAEGFDPKVIYQGQVTNVAFVEKTTGLMRSVTIIDSGDDRMVMPGLTDIRIPPQFSPKGAPVPVPDYARAYSANVADDDRSVTYTASFLVPVSPAQAVGYYTAEMPKRGYTLSPESTSLHGKGGGKMARFSRAQEFMSVVATRPDGGRLDAAIHAGDLPNIRPEETALVIVTHTRGLSPAPAGAKP